MKLAGTLQLDDFKQKHADSRTALDCWICEVKRAKWDGSHDIKRDYASASFLSDNRVIFNIKGNKYRLVIKVKYKYGIVMVEWVGTHAEYNKKNFT
jgi:mRNA interferase HigB